ncbi:hypothetical protein [Capnocytophaga sputigena]|uniref:hypothetical protein n=1 Tax=Capnocytophaga sputigena TaxID=1019 RepID=UPI0028D75EFC|nr:hypothetical protein [Capnocytophaga sputigena]
MSNFPKFILGDNTDIPNAMFVVHLEYPRFVLNLDNDEVEWLEEFDEEDTKELEAESENLIEEAIAFYEREITRIEENDY